MKIFGVLLLLLILTSCSPEPEDTFSLHLREVMAGARREAALSEPLFANFDEYFARLNEFAAQLNYGGVETADLRVTHIWGDAYRPLVERHSRRFFEIALASGADAQNADLIAQMLEFTGIKRQDILIRICRGFLDLRYAHEFLRANQAVDEIFNTRFRLWEFAAKVNQSEIVVTGIADSWTWYRLVGEQPKRRFGIAFYTREQANNQELIDQMLDFAEIEREQLTVENRVGFGAHRWADYLLVNPDIARLAHERMLLDDFAKLMHVYSVRRGLRIGTPITNVQDYNLSHFIVHFSDRKFYQNQQLHQALFAFAGIDKERVKFSWFDFRDGSMDFIGGAPHWFDAGSQAQYISILNFIDEVNAPFWQDKHAHDPVIVRVLLGHDGFVVLSYDKPTEKLREKLATAAGDRNILLKMAE